MEYGNHSKSKSLVKKIIIHQMPLFERIMGSFSAIGLTSIPLLCIIMGIEEIFSVAVFLLIMIIYSIYMFFCVFKTYICLDLVNKKLIIREVLTKKQEFPLNNFKDIKIVQDKQYKDFITIDINFVGYNKKILSWFTDPSCRLAMFNMYERQTKRLKKFISQCEEYFNNK